jgi:hypothetical protein
MILVAWQPSMGEFSANQAPCVSGKGGQVVTFV